jgi:hypothetical protein
MVVVDFQSNPFPQQPAATCEHCGLGLGGLVREGLLFRHRDQAGCADAERRWEEGWGE